MSAWLFEGTDLACFTAWMRAISVPAAVQNCTERIGRDPTCEHSWCDALSQAGVSCRHPWSCACQMGWAVWSMALPKPLLCSQETYWNPKGKKSVFQPWDAECEEVSGLLWLSSQNLSSVLLAIANAAFVIPNSLTSPCLPCAQSTWRTRESLVQEGKAVCEKEQSALRWFKQPQILHI